ncbi:MAG TPA: TolC family protein [Polyangia bacterium]|nr:TolC family protein [Polyangia bacterium]
MSGTVALVALSAAAGAARAAGDDGNADAPADRELATEARLSTILRVIGERSPDLREASERMRAAEARAGASARLPDPELKSEVWGVPLAHPLGFDQANTIMIGLRQSFPAWGSRDARVRAASEEASAAGDAAEARQQDVAAQARRAFAAYARADREYRIHLEHVGLTSRIVEIARALYQVGHGSQQDLLHAQAELSRLHVDVAGIEQQRRSAQALLNALMDRDPDAALGPTPDLSSVDVTTATSEAAADDRRLAERRPELKAAARAVKRSEAALDVAKREADLPSFMVGADYWYMPTQPAHNAYGAMVSMSLPWLNLGRRDEVRAAEHTSAADRSALRAQQAAARFQLRDADAKLRAARETLALIHDRVLADARRSFESAQASFQSGHGDVTPVLDGARNYLEVRIEEVRAMADLESDRADYARAAGLPVSGMAGMTDGGGEDRR